MDNGSGGSIVTSGGALLVLSEPSPGSALSARNTAAVTSSQPVGPQPTVNAGTVWAGLAVVSGWFVRRPAPAVAAGVVALLAAYVVHGLAVHAQTPWE